MARMPLLELLEVVQLPRPCPETVLRRRGTIPDAFDMAWKDAVQRSQNDTPSRWAPAG